MDRIDQLKKLLSSLTDEALENHIGDAEKCALKSINPGVDDDKPIRAKISLAVEWDAGGTSPKAKVKASYSVKKTEEYSSNEDLNQIDMFAQVEANKDLKGEDETPTTAATTVMGQVLISGTGPYKAKIDNHSASSTAGEKQAAEACIKNAHVDPEIIELVDTGEREVIREGGPEWQVWNFTAEVV